MATKTRSPYIRLMRLHQPVGIWLLLWPCLWSATLAAHGKPAPIMLILFAIGAVLMRSAGCIINDIADRKIDALVERTRTRPLASGELKLKQAILLLAILLACALWIALMLGPVVMAWAALSLIPVATYPLMKRITWWPQAFLGLTFNWGALMGWAAVTGTIELPALLLYGGGIFWTLGYDTIYAHQDKLDDALIGVKSTALRLGDNSKTAITAFYVAAILFWAAAGWAAGANALYFVFLILAQLHLLRQICNLDLNNPTACRAAFMSNTRLGFILFIGTLTAFI